MKAPKKKLLLYGSAVCSLCVCTALAIVSAMLAGSLESQKAAERWQGGGELSYAQISVFAGPEASLMTSTVESVRDAVNTELKTAAIEQKKDGPRIWYDAYSMQGMQMQMQGKKRTVPTVQITAVGGDFFRLHPLQLLDGSYFDDTDLMQDRVVIDEMLAWYLFGSSNVSGMEVTVNSRNYLIAGVVRHETDSASQKACGDDPRAYVPLSLYNTWLNPDAQYTNPDDPYGYGSNDDYGSGGSTQNTLSCYEVVMPDLVRGYALKTVTDALGERSCMKIVQNTGRFSLSKQWHTLTHLQDMVIVPDSIAYPYWENAARINEFRLALLLGAEILFLVWPVLCLLRLFWKGYRWLVFRIAKARQDRRDRFRTTKDIQV